MLMMPDFHNYLASRNQRALYVQGKCSKFDLLREGQLALVGMSCATRRNAGLAALAA